MTNKPTSRDQTPAQNFRMSDAMWLAWGRVCKRLGTDRTARILDAARADIAEHGNEQDRADLAKAEQELAERRARMHPGRPRKDRVET